MIRSSWGQKLRQVFESIGRSAVDGAGAALAPLCVPSGRYEPMRKVHTPGEKIVQRRSAASRCAPRAAARVSCPGA